MTKVLLVDDHEVVRRGLKQLLLEEFSSMRFGEATYAADAMKCMTESEWDLVLLDINLPGGSGLDILPTIKRKYPKTAVLVLSSYIEEEFAVRSFKLGADGYLTKTSVADEMVAAVRKLLEGGKYVSASLAERLASEFGPSRRIASHETLSPRELEILCHVARGLTAKDIAHLLQLSEKTVGTYRSRVSEKLGLSTNVELARYALKHRLVD